MEFFAENIKIGEVLVQLLAFIIVFWTLKKLAWKPLLAALENRRLRIQGDFDKIEAARKDIEKIKAEYAAHLQKIEDEARSRLQQAVEEGRKIAREMQEKARTESQASFDKAKENLDLEIAKARLAFRREISGLALQVAERVVRESMTGERQEKKALEIIEELEKAL